MASSQIQFRVLLVTAIRSLLLHKLRSLLTVLGLVFGVASVVVMLAVAEGAEREAAKEIESLGIRNIYLKSVKPESSEDSGLSGLLMGGKPPEFGLKLKDIAGISTLSKLISNVSPVRRTEKLIMFGGESEEVNLQSVWPDYLETQQIDIVDGRFIEKLDNEYRRNVCVIGEGLARLLFDFKDPVGKLVSIKTTEQGGRGQAFRIVGVTRDPTVEGMDIEVDIQRDIYIPLATDLARFGSVVVSTKAGSFSKESVELTDILVQVRELGDVNSTSRLINSYLDRAHPDDDYSLSVPLNLLERARRQQQIFAIVVGSIAAISLIVGGIGIMNIMLATVSERTREIGIRRALGAKRSDIILQFLVETITLSFVGAAIGLLLGVAAPTLITRITNVPTHISVWTLVSAVVVAILVGVSSGVYPARQAAQLDPVQALQQV